MLARRRFCSRKLSLVEGAAVLKLAVQGDLVVQYIRYYLSIYLLLVLSGCDWFGVITTECRQCSSITVSGSRDLCWRLFAVKGYEKARRPHVTQTQVYYIMHSWLSSLPCLSALAMMTGQHAECWQCWLGNMQCSAGRNRTLPRLGGESFISRHFEGHDAT